MINKQLQITFIVTAIIIMAILLLQIAYFAPL